jgi:hypothetical protein
MTRAALSDFALGVFQLTAGEGDVRHRIIMLPVGVGHD